MIEPMEPDNEQPCQICHSFDCKCPECEVCGVAGDPACINTHMPWIKWPAFTAPSNDPLPIEENDLPTLGELRGSCPPLPNGISSEDFVRKLRNEW